MENHEEKKTPVTVEVIDGGPLRIRGKIILRDLKRDLAEIREEVLICACGRSGNMPYCDESHCSLKKE
ncbi:MAG: CDGSH iron-sulfur domain-containing protein [Bacteroidales bacterium]